MRWDQAESVAAEQVLWFQGNGDTVEYVVWLLDLPLDRHQWHWDEVRAEIATLWLRLVTPAFPMAA